jgi:hypothetical protein
MYSSKLHVKIHILAFHVYDALHTSPLIHTINYFRNMKVHLFQMLLIVQKSLLIVQNVKLKRQNQNLLL